MNIFHSNKYAGFVRKLLTIIPPVRNVENSIALEDPNFYQVPKDGKILLVSDPEEAKQFTAAVKANPPKEKLLVMDIWDQPTLNKRSPDYFLDHPFIRRGSIISDVKLNTTNTAEIANKMPSITGSITKIIQDYDSNTLSEQPIYFLGGEFPNFNTPWYKHLMLSYLPHLSYMHEISSQIIIFSELANKATQPMNNLREVQVQSIANTLDTINRVNVTTSLAAFTTDLTTMANTIKNTQIQNIFAFGGVRLIAGQFLDTLTEFYARFCATADAVSKNQFLWRKGKRALKQFKKKYFVGSKGYQKMKKIYKENYTKEVESFKGSPLNSQNAMSGRVSEYYLMMTFLSEIISLQATLILNCQNLATNLDAIYSQLNGPAGLIVGLVSEKNKWDTLMQRESKAVAAPYYIASQNLQNCLAFQLPIIDALGPTLGFMKENAETLTNLNNDLANLHNNIINSLNALQGNMMINNLLNGMITVIGFAEIAGGNLLTKKQLKDVTKDFILVWLQQMRDILKTTRQYNKQNQGFLKSWNLIKEFAEAHSKNLKRERRNRIILFCLVLLILAIVGFGVDWNVLLDSDSFINLISNLWDQIKVIPTNLMESIKSLNIFKS